MKKSSSRSKKSKRQKSKQLHIDAGWECLNPHAAGIDIGLREHWVCVPAQASEQPVRRFGTFTEDLEALAQWLQQCGITTVAMEATGVYWIPVFQILESRGLAVVLVNPRHIKHVSGRKSDVSDCQWIQRLHTYGLLQGSFRPADPYCVLRTYLRYRDELVSGRTAQCQHLQKALQQMNIQLTQVLSDITGESGLAIIRAIVQGERDEAKLASMVNYRVRASTQSLRAALRGDYRPEHLFVLRQALELYDTYQAKILACEEQIARELPKLSDKVDVAAKPLPARKPGRAAHLDQMGGLDLREGLYQKFGVDLTAIEGIGVLTSLTLLTELGPDLSRFPNEKRFCSYLGLCPDNRISGGKVLSGRTRRVVNRAADALRIAASSLERSQTALGAYFRRMKAKLGAAEAVTATAHKLARLVYRLIKYGDAYVRTGMEAYEKKYQARKLHALKKAAKSMGFQLIEAKAVA